jgi:hypothetical protein
VANKLAPWRPWRPVEVNVSPVVGPGLLNKADALAIKMVAIGEATPDQQKRAIDAIVGRIACAYELSFRADDHGGTRETDFGEGKRFVGLQLLKLINTQLDILTGEDTRRSQPPSPR